MAERRMFARKIVESDAFLSMPPSAQALYFHLGMAADDDGFLNGGMQTLKSVGGKPKDLQVLVDKRFVLRFDRGILLIKHWRMANSLKNDRARMPLYPDLAAQIYIRPNKAYTDHPVDGCQTLLEYKTSYASKKMESKAAKNGIQMESGWNPNGFPIEQNGTERNRTERNRREWIPARAARLLALMIFGAPIPDNPEGTQPKPSGMLWTRMRSWQAISWPV